MTVKTLTPKQKKVLDYIADFFEKKEYPPSLEEIARHFRRSIPTIHQYVETLRDKGFLRKTERAVRGIELNRPEADIFLLGYIAAGRPIEPIENPEPIKVPSEMVRSPGHYYALKVEGDSMVEDGIWDGDTIVVKHQPTAENGDTIVAITEKGAILKRLKRKNGKIYLEPRNKKLKNIYPKELEIRGKFCGLIRRPSDRFTPNSASLFKLREEFHELTINYIQNTNRNYRKSKGQYFTPYSIREKLLKQLPNTKKSPKVLDPACGTGEFLLSASKYFKEPFLYGWDIEEELIKSASMIVPQANLKVIDSLKYKTKEKFNFIIGNPPYFEFKPENIIKKGYQEVINGRPNIFAFFIKLGLELLKPGGYLAYVLPPSMNNGAYFANLRKYIVKHSNIEYLSILNGPKLFHEALQTTMLLVLKKKRNRGDYIFQKNGITIFTEKSNYLKKSFEGKTTLRDLGFQVKTGRLVWNQNKSLLTNNSKEGIPLIWAHNITSKGLELLNNSKKPQYIKAQNYDTGPAIVVNRITGNVNSVKLKAAIIPEGMKFIGENHVNVIFPPSQQRQMRIDLEINIPKFRPTLKDIATQLSSKEKLEVVRNITGNTQMSKTEIENLFPINPD